jgi:hypothetical protein
MEQKDKVMEEINLSIEHATKLKELKDAINRLQKNRDFKKVFTTELFQKEPARITALLTDHAMLEQRNLLVEDLMVISGVQTWLRSKVALGESAERSIVEATKLSEDIENED